MSRQMPAVRSCDKVVRVASARSMAASSPPDEGGDVALELLTGVGLERDVGFQVMVRF